MSAFAKAEAAGPKELREHVKVARLALLDGGFQPVVLSSWNKRVSDEDDGGDTYAGGRGKSPVQPGWQVPRSEEEMRRRLEGADLTACNTGISTRGLRGVDVDIDDPTLVERIVELARQHLGAAPMRRRSNSARVAFLYRAVEGYPAKREVVGKHGKVEVLGRGQQMFVYGRHGTGAYLEWVNADGEVVEATDLRVDELPEVAEGAITRFLDAVAEVIEATSAPDPDERARRAERDTAGYDGDAFGKMEIGRAEELLKHIDVSQPREVWRNVGMALKDEFGEDGYGLWHDWSATDCGKGENGRPRYPGERELRRQWDSFRGSGITISTLDHLAKEGGADTDAIREKHRREARLQWAESDEGRAFYESVASIQRNLRAKRERSDAANDDDRDGECPPDGFWPDPDEGEDDEGGGEGDDGADAVGFHSVADWADRPVPTREWLTPDLVPMNTVTLLSGDGGTGKSLLAFMLAAAVAAGADWMGRGVRSGKAIYFAAEDDSDELHRRFDDIATHLGKSYQDMAGLTVRSLAGETALLADELPAKLQKTTALVTSELYKELDARAKEDKPTLIVIDTLADVYPANENDRAKVRQFIGFLRKLALDHRCAVVLLAHPSLSGMSNGSGTSGSTAWNNSVRSRLYLTKPAGDDGLVLDENKRVLKTMKANYSATGGEIHMMWRGGVFVCDQRPGATEGATRKDRACEVFLKLLDKMTEQNNPVNARSGPRYAPKVFSTHPQSEGFSKNEFRTAMHTLTDDGVITNVTRGPPSRMVTFIARAEMADDFDDDEGEDAPETG